MSERNKDIARTYLERFVSGDIEGTLAMIADDARYHVTGMPKPLGKKDVEGMVAMFTTAFHGRKHELIRQTAEGDWVSSTFTFHGTHGGPFQGLAATGKSFSVLAMNDLRIRDGKVVEIQGVMDTLGLVRALGATIGLP